jgi:5'-nucleotidase / UDP-sugar diphosphatase
MNSITLFTTFFFSRYFRWLFALLGTVLLLLPASTAWVRPDSTPNCEAQTVQQSVWPACSDQSAIQKITFVHVSDIHARYNPDKDGSNPMGRIRGYYLQAKKENPFTLFTNAGDDYEKGSVAEELSRGKSTRKVVEAMQYDVRTLGNHDFSWGIEELLHFSHDPAAAVVATNTAMSSEEPSRYMAPGWTDFTVLTVGCVRIGFFGLVSKPWNERDQQYEGPFYPAFPALQTDFHFIERAGDIISQHRKEVDLLVLVSHLGLPDDISLAEQTTGIDLILGGHSHTTMKAPIQVNRTTIVHAGAFGQTLGRFDIDIDVRNKRIIDSSFQLVANRPGDMPEDLATTRNIENILKKYGREMNETITEISRDQDKQAMALIAAHAAVTSLKTDAALINRGTVGPEWRQGRLTRQDILNSFKVERQPSGTPGQSSLYVMTVKGADLLYAAAEMADSVFLGPSAINPMASYTLAIQKAQAFNQRELLGRMIGLSSPEPATELWETVVAYARDRRVEGLSLDEGLGKRRIDNLMALLQGENDAAFFNSDAAR